MRTPQLLFCLLATSSRLAAAEPQTAAIYIQPVTANGAAPPPTLLAEITYDLAVSDDAGSSSSGAKKAEVTAFEAPELPDDDAALVRIGIYDPEAGTWAGSTSVAAVGSFGKGYSPRFVLSVLDEDELSAPEAEESEESGSREKEEGEQQQRRRKQQVVLGASCRGVRVDAGATRDFGPQASVMVAGRGRQPALNKPIVLSAEGKQVPPEEEKTLLQKYWWLAALLVFLLATGGGEGK